MTEKYTPEKVAELVTALKMNLTGEYDVVDSLMRDAADALTAVSADVEMWKQETDDAKAYAVLVEAERDEAISLRNRAYRQRDDERAAKEGNVRALNTALVERDRLHKAIEEALALWSRSQSAIATEPRHILRAALDKEGESDE